MSEKIEIHVEAVRRSGLELSNAEITAEIAQFLEANFPIFRVGVVDISSSAGLSSVLESLQITDISAAADTTSVSFWQAKLCIHVFELFDEAAEQEFLQDDSNGETSVPACEQWMLPCSSLHTLWESIVVEHTIKDHLLSHAATSMLFADAGIDPNLISWNKVVLLHGPPGTGKTSLCKALAQKLAIRLNERYSSAQLLEINAHSLFSKWFSESGKLVMRLFGHIAELAEDEDSLIFVLIDEVESLTAARGSALKGSEPSDAIRVVNAVLTQLDNLRRRPNVLILCTSNLSDAIDVAFIDRADIKCFIGPPNHKARYSIFLSSIQELVRVQIIRHEAYNFRSFDTIADSKQSHDAADGTDTSEQGYQAMTGELDEFLWDIARQCEDVSGRTLRKLPFLAHAYFIRKMRCGLDEFLVALQKAVAADMHDREKLHQHHV